MMGRVASLVGCTEGQAYTILIALALSLSMAALGLPPALEARSGAPLAAPDDAPGGGGAPPEQTLTTEDPPAAEDEDDETVDLPDTTRVADEPSGVATDAPEAPAASADDAAGPQDDDAFELEQGERLEEQFGAVQLFARVEEPGVPHGVAVASDAVYVTTDNAPGRGGSGPSRILAYTREGELTGELELEGQAQTRLRGAPDVVVDHEQRVLVLDTAAGRILEADVASGEQSTHAELPDLEACALPVTADPCEPGAVGHEPRPVGMAVAPGGDLLVTDAAQATIWQVAADGESRVWHQDPGYRPGLPGEGGLAGLTFDRDGHVLVTVSSALAEGSPGEGMLHRIEVDADGSAGSREELLRTGPADAPADVAAGASGRIYLTLAGADELLVLAADGTEEERFTTQDVAQDAGVDLDGPAGLAFDDDAVLVANSAVRGDDENWAVVRIAVEDEVAER